VQGALTHQLVDRLARLERGVELYEGVWPEQPLCETVKDY
jgi:hypothetical protein